VKTHTLHLEARQEVISSIMKQCSSVDGGDEKCVKQALVSDLFNRASTLERMETSWSPKLDHNAQPRVWPRTQHEHNPPQTASAALASRGGASGKVHPIATGVVAGDPEPLA
jgi:hypothetical protein